MMLPLIFSIDAVNKFVNVTFVSETRIVCTFLGLHQNQGANSLMCGISYGPCQQTPMTSQGDVGSPNTVNIELPASMSSGTYCYTINASNGTYTVLVEGIISAGYNNIKAYNKHC